MPQYRLCAVGKIEVFRDGVLLDAAPTKACAALLIGMAVSGRQLGREEVARELYPDQDASSARGALRKSLQRMREWLGPEALVQEGERLCLSDSWTFDFSPETIARSDRARLGLPYQHRWLANLRSDSKGVASERLIRSIEEAAEVDRDAARALLVGARAMVSALAVPIRRRLLALVQPKSLEAPFASEFYVIDAISLITEMRLPEARDSLAKATRIARNSGDQEAFRYAAAYQLFTSIESGDEKRARSWANRVERMRGPSKHGMYMDNSLACYLWNLGDRRAALEIMERAVDAHYPERGQTIHLLANLSVLLGELGERDRSLAAQRRVEALLRVDSPVAHQDNLLIAEGARAISQGEPAGAIPALMRLREIATSEGSTAGTQYSEFYLAECYAMIGESSRARELLRSVASRRNQVGAKPTIAQLERESRIRGMLA